MRFILRALLAFTLVPSATVAAECRELKIAAGSQGGAYHALASDLDRALRIRQSAYCLTVLETAGSYENAELVRSGEAPLALLQSDVAFLENYAGRSFVALATLFDEAVHIVSRSEFGWTDLDDLRTYDSPLRVSVGPARSGSAAHGLAILDSLGLLGTAEIQNLGRDATLAALRKRELEVAFFTSAVPIVPLEELLETRVIVLQPIGSHWIRKLRRENPFLYSLELRLGAYPNLDHNLSTLGTRTLLMGRRTLESEVVTELLETLTSPAFAKLRGAVGERPNLDRLVLETPIGFHTATLAYTTSANTKLVRFWRWLRPNILPLLLAMMVVFLLLRTREIVPTLYQRVLLRVVALVGFVWLVGSLAIYFLENARNAAFSSFPRASTAILLYLFSGLEAKVPVTTAGNVVAIVMLVSGAIILTFFSATLVEILIKRAFNLKHLWIKPKFFRFKNHVVIAGWSGRTERVLRQLRSKDLKRHPRVVVIAEKALEARVSSRREFRDVWVVEGRPWSSTALKEAGVPRASTALVLTPSEVSEEERLKEVSTALAIERMAPEIRTVVEASSPEIREHLRRALSNVEFAPSGSDGGALDEIVETSVLCERMISQALITPGITRFYDEVLVFGRDSQELYTERAPRACLNRSFHEVRYSLAESELMPIGLWLSTTVKIRGRKESTPLVLNPTAVDELRDYLIQEKDRFVYLADEGGCLSRAVRRAVKKPPSFPSEYQPNGGDKLQSETRRIGICGWSTAAREIIKELQSDVIAEKRHFFITVIVEPEAAKREGLESPRNVRFVCGDPQKPADLVDAGLEAFESLVVLAERDANGRPAGKYVDHRSLLIALAATEQKKGLHVVVEVIDSANREHFERIDNCEIVSVEDLTERLLAQAVVTPGITKVVLRLLTANAETNEVYVVDVPPAWHSRTFQELYLGALDARADFIPLGYEAVTGDGGRGLVINPSQAKKMKDEGVVSWREYEFRDGDKLVVVAYNEPDLEGLVPADR